MDDRKQSARFWRYDGNHPAGCDHERYDPNSFGLGLVSAMAYWGDEELPPPPPLTYEDIMEIHVVHHKGDDFGHEVTVSAPAKVWERGQQALERFCAEYGLEGL